MAEGVSRASVSDSDVGCLAKILYDSTMQYKQSLNIVIMPQGYQSPLKITNFCTRTNPDEKKLVFLLLWFKLTQQP